MIRVPLLAVLAQWLESSVWSAIADSELATAKRIDTVQATIGENTTAIQTEIQARTTADTGSLKESTLSKLP